MTKLATKLQANAAGDPSVGINPSFAELDFGHWAVFEGEELVEFKQAFAAFMTEWGDGHVTVCTDVEEAEFRAQEREFEREMEESEAEMRALEANKSAAELEYEAHMRQIRRNIEILREAAQRACAMLGAELDKTKKI